MVVFSVLIFAWLVSKVYHSHNQSNLLGISKDIFMLGIIMIKFRNSWIPVVARAMAMITVSNFSIKNKVEVIRLTALSWRGTCWDTVEIHCILHSVPKSWLETRSFFHFHFNVCHLSVGFAGKFVWRRRRWHTRKLWRNVVLNKDLQDDLLVLSRNNNSCQQPCRPRTTNTRTSMKLQYLMKKTAVRIEVHNYVT